MRSVVCCEPKRNAINCSERVILKIEVCIEN